ncbi:MAG TPA: site-specific DNA-methyltransferase [Bacteroidia bacterium]|jgi:adenine-specific DNA-methyltransferase|nr:site-specific DNA-methyltransferase [Bacteroidia bacterium]
MNSVSKQEKELIIELLQKGEPIPEDLKYKLFPVKQREYELVYGGKMRKEDILANEDGVFPVPLQIEKVFNGDRKPFSDGWQNIIVFGDNLQFLKTIYENKYQLIRGKVKGKVKLIYIDPPFGTGDEYDGNKGQKGYTAKTKGAEYVEFVRRRLIVAKEILAEDGVIMVRQGFNFGHYIKIILDDIFGKANFVNEILVNRGKQRLGGTKKYSTATDTVYFYANSENYFFQGFKRERYGNEAKGTNMLMKGKRNPPERTFIDPNGQKVVLLPPGDTHWKFVQPKIDEMYEKGVMYLAKSQKGLQSGIMKKVGNKLIPVDYVPSFKFDDDKTVDANWTDIPGYSQETGYPTENSEQLLHRVIHTATKEGDLLMDFFGGSGTTAAVAEKSNRKWITCDIGKLSFYTIQKRLLNIQNSKHIDNPKIKYGKLAKSFITVNTGYYDLKKVFQLKQNEYCGFVRNLFEIEELDKKINGINIDGQKKDGYYCQIYPYWQFRDASVDEDYIKDLHSHIGTRIGNRFYIVAPANYVDFVSDYFEIGKVKYYFLKVPYHVIKELHKAEFKKYRQPQSKSNVNDLEDAIGFHFMRQPQVESKLNVSKNQVQLHIKKFVSDFTEQESGHDMENFESLAMVLLDLNYNGKEFEMGHYFFAEDLLPKKAKVENQLDVFAEQLKQQKEIILPPFTTKECGKRIMVVYVDIYGNEFKEELKIK